MVLYWLPVNYRPVLPPFPGPVLPVQRPSAAFLFSPGMLIACMRAGISALSGWPFCGAGAGGDCLAGVLPVEGFVWGGRQALRWPGRAGQLGCCPRCCPAGLPQGSPRDARSREVAKKSPAAHQAPPPVMSRPVSLTIPACGPPGRRAGGMRQRLSRCPSGPGENGHFPAATGNFRQPVRGQRRGPERATGVRQQAGRSRDMPRPDENGAQQCTRPVADGYRCCRGRVMAGPARAMGITRHGRVIPHSGAAWVTTRGAGRGSRTGKCPPLRANPGSGRADAGPGVACAQSAPARCIAARVSSGRWSRCRSGRSRRRSGASS